MTINLVTGLTDAQLADYELRAEMAMLVALHAVADQMADQIASIQIASAGPSRLLADVRQVWAGCPYGFHDVHAGPCPQPGAVAVLVAADPPPVPDIPGPPGQPYVSPDDLAQMTRLWDDQVQQQLMPVVAEVYQTSAGTVHAQMIGASGVAVLPSVSSQAAEEYLAAARNTFDMVGDSLWQNARNSLLDGFKAGDSIPELAARVRGSAQMTAPTATLVARTQVLDASNSGSIATARASGLNLRKGWFATPDLRTRPSHMTAGHTYGTERGYIPLDQPFYVGGQACDRPHDPVLSPAERYSCRCTVGYAVSSAAPQQQAQRQVPPLPGQSGAPAIPPLTPPAPMVPPAQLPGGQVVAELRAAQTARIEELAAAQQAELAAMVADQHAAVDAVLAAQRARFAAQTAEHQRQVRHFEAQAAKRHARVDEIAEDHRAGMAQVTQQARDRAAALDELSVQQSVEIDNILAGQQAAVRRILADEEARVRRISSDISAALRRRGVRPVPGRPAVPPVGPAPLQRALPEIDLGEPIRGVRSALHVARTNDELVVAMRAEVARITGRQIVVELPPDASLASARELFEGVLQGMEAYPQSTIRRISWFARRDGHYAETSADEILFNQHWISRARRTKFIKRVQADVADWDIGLPAWMPRNAGTPQALGVHEYSHAVHLSLGADAKALSARAVAIVQRRAALEGITPDALIRREIGAYATADDLELIAGAATDVATNGRAASLLSREIMEAYDEAYRTAGRAPGRTMFGRAAPASDADRYIYSADAPTLGEIIAAERSYRAESQVRMALAGEYPGGLKVRVGTVAIDEEGVHIEGTIFNAQGRKVGEFTRRITKDAEGRLIAHHDILSLSRKMDQGSGFAEAFNGNLMDWYRRSGVSEIRLTANIDVGGYAWASAGYDFLDAAAAAKWLDLAEEKVFKALAAFRQAGKLPKGMTEDGLRSLQALIEDIRAGRTVASAPEVARFGRLPGQGGKAAVWPGKWLMLGEDISWKGRLAVTPIRRALAVPGRVAARAEPGPVPIPQMTVGQLKALARERGIPGYTAMRKQELVDALSGPAPVKAAKAVAKKAAPKAMTSADARARERLVDDLVDGFLVDKPSNYRRDPKAFIERTNGDVAQMRREADRYEVMAGDLRYADFQRETYGDFAAALRDAADRLDAFDSARLAKAAPAKAATKAAAKKAPAKKTPAPKPLPTPERMTGPALRKELEAAGVDLPAKVAKPDLQRWVTELRAAPASERDAVLGAVRRQIVELDVLPLDEHVRLARILHGPYNPAAQYPPLRHEIRARIERELDSLVDRGFAIKGANGAYRITAKGRAAEAASRAARVRSAQLADLASDTGPARARLEALAARTPASERSLSGGAMGEVKLLDFGDVTAVEKRYPRLAGQKLKDEIDAEILAPEVFRALGLRAPAVIDDGTGRLLIEYADPMPYGLSRGLIADEGLYESQEGRLFGLADELIDNQDRNGGNWMLDWQGHIVAIDHGESFGQRIVGPELGPFREYLEGGGRITGLSQSQITKARKALEALRPKFEARGRGDWFRAMMRRLDAVEGRIR